MNKIKSSDNKKIKEIKKLLANKKYRKVANSFIVEGLRCINGFISFPQKRYSVDSLYVKESLINTTDVQQIIDSFVSKDIFCLDDNLFSNISDVENSQGIVAKINISPDYKVVFNGNRYLLLDNLSDPGNMGTLIRSAVGAGYDGLLFFGNTVDIYNPKVIRSTMGTIPYIDVLNINIDEITSLKKAGYAVIAADANGDDDIYSLKLPEKSVLVVGNEANGLSKEIRDIASHVVSIPVARECESLNAAVAGSIMMFMLK